MGCISIVSLIDAVFTYLGKQIIDVAIIPGNISALVRIVVIYGSLILIQAVFVLSMIFLTGMLGERMRYDLRKKLFNHLQDLSLSYYSRTPVGWIMSRVTSDTDRVAELVTWGMLDTTWAVMNFITSAYFMLRINAPSGGGRADDRAGYGYRGDPVPA